MFLRGYGSQNYEQYNRNYVNNNKIIPYKKTITNYKSGELGKIQGDADRLLTFAEPMHLQFDSVGWNEGHKYVTGGLYPKGDASWDFLDVGSDGQLDFYKYVARDFHRDTYKIQHLLNLQHYKYSIGNMSPCGIASINEEIVAPMDGEIFTANMNVSARAWSNAFTRAIDNEIRPVNVAVRYYIKAK